jgi:hypothetical protein
MKLIEKAGMSFGILGVLVVVGLILSLAGLSFYGIYLAFSASIILGIIALFVQPSPFVFGVCMVFGKNIPEIIQAWADFPI